MLIINVVIAGAAALFNIKETVTTRHHIPHEVYSLVKTANLYKEVTWASSDLFENSTQISAVGWKALSKLLALLLFLVTTLPPFSRLFRTAFSQLSGPVNPVNFIYGSPLGTWMPKAQSARVHTGALDHSRCPWSSHLPRSCHPGRKQMPHWSLIVSDRYNEN